MKQTQQKWSNPGRSRAAGSENTAPEVIAICLDRYGAVPVGPVDSSTRVFQSFYRLRMGKTKDIIKTATDYGRMWLDLFKKRSAAGSRTTVVRYKEHIAL
jgi:hypothetical protein